MSKDNSKLEREDIEKLIEDYVKILKNSNKSNPIITPLIEEKNETWNEDKFTKESEEILKKIVEKTQIKTHKTPTPIIPQYRKYNHEYEEEPDKSEDEISSYKELFEGLLNRIIKECKLDEGPKEIIVPARDPTHFKVDFKKFLKSKNVPYYHTGDIFKVGLVTLNFL